MLSERFIEMGMKFSKVTGVDEFGNFRNKGWGMVRYKEPKMARKAIWTVHGTKLRSRFIKVKPFTFADESAPEQKPLSEREYEQLPPLLPWT